MIERNAFHHVDWAPFVKQQIFTDVGLSRFVIDSTERREDYPPLKKKTVNHLN